MPTPLPLPSSISWVDTQGRYLHLRPQRDGDANLLGALWNRGLSAAARHNRFLGQSGPLTAAQIAEQAALACTKSSQAGQGWLIVERMPGVERALAEGRWTAAASRHEGLLALSVMTRCQGQGLARQLLQELLRSGPPSGLHGLSLHVLEANVAALRLAGRLGFERKTAIAGSPWLRLLYRFQARPSKPCTATKASWLRWRAATSLTLQLSQEDFHV